MTRFFSVVASVCTALWLGGMIFLFIGVQTLFREFPKQSSNIATEAAPRLFSVFELYQFALAAVALVAAFMWYLLTRSKLVMTVFLLLTICAGASAFSTLAISRKMHQLRAEGQSGSPAFMKLHGQSMIVYVSQAGLLLLTSIILPLASAKPRRKDPATAPG